MTIRIRKSNKDCSRGGRNDSPLVDRPYTRVFEAVEKGERVGCLRIDDTGEGVTPFWSWVSPAHRRRGIGTKLYEAAARGACKSFKQPLASDLDLSDESRGFWEKQLRKGRARCDAEDKKGRCTAFSLSCPAPASLAAPPLLEPMIQEKERELVKWKQERGVLFDKHGRIVLQKKGTKHKLSFDEDDLALFPDRYLTHNHPGVNFSTFESGGSLSPADVAVAARRNLAEVRAVTRVSIDGKQRTIVYRIERPAGGWPESWRIKDEAEAASARLKWVIEKEWRDGKRTYEQTATAVMHETWLEVAPKLGLKYDWVLLDGAELAGGRRRRRRVHSR